MLKMRERGHEKDFISSQSEEQHSIELLRCYDFILFPFFSFFKCSEQIVSCFRMRAGPLPMRSSAEKKIEKIFFVVL
jgi:hypothetical protein